MKIKKKHKYNAIIYTPVNVVLHILPYASFVTNNIFLLLMFTVTHFVSYKRLCIIWKETAFVSTVLSELQCSGSLLWIFFYHRAKENVKYFFSAWFSDHGLLVKNDQQWKTFRVTYNMNMFRKKIFFPYLQVMTL